MGNYFVCRYCETHIITKGKRPLYCPVCEEYKGIEEVSKKEFENW